jgi:hypothetical protein
MTEMIELGSFAYIEDVVASASQQFPKRCTCCDVEFKSFAEFIEKTYIPEHNDSRNIQIIQCEDGNVKDGYILAYRNCACHSTITILCALEDELKAKMFEAIEKDAKTMGVSMESVMELIRDKIVSS